jgi:hypothetical protein
MPFLHEGKAWMLYYTNFFYKERYQHPSHEDWLMIKDKEIIGKKEYFLLQLEVRTIDSNTHGWEKKSAISSSNYDGEKNDDRLFVHVREDKGRVFVLKDDYISFCFSKYGIGPDISSMQADEEDEILLYDFNLQVGDTYPSPDHVTVEETGDITYEGSSYPYQLLSNSLLIVEGVGCVNSFGGIIAYQSAPAFGNFDRYATFLNFVIVEDDQKEIFQYLNVVSENLLLGICNNYFNNHPEVSSIHDLQGRPLNGAPQKGVYIKDGRKYLK